MTEGITTDCPYYLAAKGLHPEGIFVWDDYEASHSLNQELTFQDAERFFAEEHIPFGQEQKRTLGLVSEDGVFTNLGLLLSDQCNAHREAGVFSGLQQDGVQGPGRVLGFPIQTDGGYLCLY